MFNAVVQIWNVAIGIRLIKATTTHGSGAFCILKKRNLQIAIDRTTVRREDFRVFT